MERTRSCYTMQPKRAMVMALVTLLSVQQAASSGTAYEPTTSSKLIAELNTKLVLNTAPSYKCYFPFHR